MTLVVWHLTVDTRPIPSVHKLRTDKRNDACNKVFGTHGSTADYLIFLIVLVFLWASFLVWLHNCNIYVEWPGVMYMCVPVLCPKALAQHHWMLRPAQWGLNFIKGIIFLANLQRAVILKTGFSLAVCGSQCSFQVWARNEFQ